jgi:1-phosphofructokinase
MTDTTERVLVFDPIPLLTITVEVNAETSDDVHVHAGGQGVWLARMVRALGAQVLLCAAFGGETGTVARHLLDIEGIPVRDVTAGGATVAYVHDRRSGDREPLAEMPAQPLARHELDELYETTLVEGLGSQVCVLAGPRGPHVLPSDTYARLATDLRANGRLVVADLDGDPLLAALDAGLDVLKMSDEQLVANCLAASNDQADVRDAMQTLQSRGAASVVISRADQPTFALSDRSAVEVSTPQVQPIDHRGGGDSLTAGIAAGLARGLRFEEALRLGAAAGTLNVTRRGLGTGNRREIEQLMEFVAVHPLETPPISLAAGGDD